MQSSRFTPRRYGLIAAAALAWAVVMSGLTPLGTTSSANAATAVPDVAKLAGKLAKQKLKWGACSDDTHLAADTIKCAMVTVPRDWKNPKNGLTWQFEMSYNKLNDPGDSRFKGIIVGNFGGPGAAGLEIASYFPVAMEDLAPYYNFVGFNPRGIDDESRPSCDYTVDPDDESALAEVKAIGRDCANDPDVKTISTEQTTYDMDFVRHLLGQEKLNYFGYSYGTWLGTWYSNVFHSRAGLMVLDSALDTTQPTYQHDKEFEPWSFKRQDDLWWDPIFERWDAAEGEAEKKPVPEELVPPGSTASEKQQERFLKLQEEKSSSAILRETAREQLGSLRELRALGGEQKSAEDETVLTDMSYMVRCNDGQYTQGEAYWKAWMDRQSAEVGWGIDRLAAIECLNWRTQNKMPVADPETYPKTVVLQAELDANTAWEHGRATGLKLPNTKFIAVDNEGEHGLFPYGTEEVDRKVINFYLSGKLPKANITVAQGKPRTIKYIGIVLYREDVTYEHWKPLNKKAKHVGELVTDPWQPAGTPKVVPVPIEGSEMVRKGELDAAFRAWVSTNYGTRGLSAIS